MSLTADLVGFLNLTVAMIDHIVINSKTEVKSMSVRAVYAEDQKGGALLLKY